jgi:hypothetical protein
MSACSVIGIRTTEELEYELVSQEGEYELRQYDEYYVASTSSLGSYRDATRENFRKLFRYITGDNESQQDISMTAPVELQREQIEMTAPVQIAEGEGQTESYSMNFVLPSEYQGSDGRVPPVPTNPTVAVQRVPAGLLAIKRFSGILRQSLIDEQEELLRSWIEGRGLVPEGEVMGYGFDPPWTIPFLRRNEVSLRVSTAGE